MLEQTEELLDCCEVLMPELQQALEYDASSGHLMMGDGALVAANMNLKFGGLTNQVLRDTEITEGCTGPDPATMFYHPFKKTWSLHSTSTDDIEVNCRVKDGDVQSMSFGSEPTSTGNCVHPPPPPFYLLDAPPFDVMMNAEKLAMHNAARVMLKEKEVDACVEKRGYLGKPKGIKQVLWERGLWKEGMIGLVKKDNAKYEEKGPMCASSALPRFCVRERCAAEAHRRAWAYHG
eukprot:m.292073 g.292073  ORF g.292073 m.292073 type:complete len:234 (+) comp16233_c0_seq3:647-1348(+)